MLAPFRRGRLAERGLLDERGDAEQHLQETPERRLLIGIQLSELARKLASAAGARWVAEPAHDLEEKARLWAAPLRGLGRA